MATMGSRRENPGSELEGWLRVVAAIALATAAASAHAQVFKCPGPDGKTVYSQAPCEKGGEYLDRNRLSGTSVPPSSAPRAAAREPAKTTVVREAAACPTDAEMKKLESAAAGILLSKKERQEKQAAVDAGHRCRGTSPAGRAAAEPSRDVRPNLPNDKLTSCTVDVCIGASGAHYDANPAGSGWRRRTDGAQCLRSAGGYINCE
jgi:hypothetical protein